MISDAVQVMLEICVVFLNVQVSRSKVQGGLRGKTTYPGQYNFNEQYNCSVD